ncbi:MAG TPA: hypothetical protein DD618_00030 [Acholeplasmatales bacterium]|nr:hypothetical protein [Acholeplasmatales bacterium]
MNLMQPFKLHFYAYRLVYLAFWIFEAILVGLGYLFMASLPGTPYYLAIVIIAVSCLFSYLIGMYEFSRLCYHYLNLKTNRFGFYLSSFLFAFFNALTHTVVILGIFALINLVFLKTDTPAEFNFPYLAPSTYLFVFAANLTVFFFANAAALFFKHLKFLKILIYISLIITVSIFFGDIISFVISKTAAFFFDPDLIFRVIPIMLACNVYFILVTFVQSRTIDLKK